MSTDGIKFSLKHLFAWTTVFCVVSALSAFISIILVALMAAVIGVVVFDELEFSESRLHRAIGLLVFILGLLTSSVIIMLSLSQRWLVPL